MCGLEEESDDKSNNIIPETDDGYKVEGHWIWEDWAKEPGYRSMRVRVIEERACPMNCEVPLFVLSRYVLSITWFRYGSLPCFLTGSYPAVSFESLSE